MGIAVLASGSGSNFEALVQASQEGRIPAKITLLIVDNPQAGAIERARRLGISFEVVDREAFAQRADFEAALRTHIDKSPPALIALAGFMRVLSPDFVSAYPNKILNIHPALLPGFPGAHGIHDAYSYGVQITGVTVHYVDEGVDTGPIVLQEALAVDPAKSEEELEAQIHQIEHRLYPEAVRLHLEGKLKVEGRRVSSLRTQ
ncbi:MAG: phosphoribosylglycinamide formyltransferase [Candidatus Omnitrophica bacterium]|nr:phosphoribosylglycinamide formyltransferase [Candidatus Omnitrophota bacterium]